MACGPLLGALLGDAGWPYPFFGTAFLMAVGFLCITAFLKEQPQPARRTDVLVLGHGDHTTAVVCTILSGALIGVDNTVYTEPALGVSDAPRPAASTGYNFGRWFAAAAAPSSHRGSRSGPTSTSRSSSRRSRRCWARAWSPYGEGH
ncbi:hypothetical protein GCM10010254_08500 [Streptomyces chromofuscus]|nr:hypothetical protein GCM10010254_08500 [Streptomyces chromofuscus]